MCMICFAHNARKESVLMQLYYMHLTETLPMEVLNISCDHGGGGGSQIVQMHMMFIFPAVPTAGCH